MFLTNIFCVQPWKRKRFIPLEVFGQVGIDFHHHAGVYMPYPLGQSGNIGTIGQGVKV